MKSRIPLMLLAAIGISAALLKTASGQSAADACPYPPPGKMIDIGGYSLHLNAIGQAAPTVVLIAGAGDFSFDWSLVQPTVSKLLRSVHTTVQEVRGAIWDPLRAP